MPDSAGTPNQQSGCWPTDFRVHYQRLRSPANDGETLELPPLAQVESLWRANVERQSDQRSPLLVPSLDQLRKQGRAEVLALAKQYTGRYRDVDLDGRDQTSILMSGHQPQLFHAGVWFKNFALSSVAAKLNSVPINLVVDNDLCGNTAIRFPRFANGQASIGMLPYDAPGANVPHEMHSIVDRNLFDSFANRVVAQEQQNTGNLLVERLWPYVVGAADQLTTPNLLGASIAAGRHRLEQDAGLQTLEVPLSHIADTPSFGSFAAAIMLHQQRFNQAYNTRLYDYRKVHKIRSSAHPVPPLQLDDGWLESPFWVWSESAPLRKRLFVRILAGQVELTDRQGWHWQVKTNDLASTWGDWSKAGIKIRPRALITTMFCRLILSDLFFHGIGGAKYDQLTDTIASDFFEVSLPTFATLSATVRPPLNAPLAAKSDLTAVRQRIRELDYHPEKSIAQPDQHAAGLIQQKQASVLNEAKVAASERHQAIAECNRRLQQIVSEQRIKLEGEAEQLPERIRTSRILGSREYSFCLFPTDLMQQLKSLADVV